MEKPLDHKVLNALQSVPGVEVETDRFLLAISGGMDSVVLGHICLAAGFSFQLAHCNFQLRGGASDGDQIFVETLGKDWECITHTIRFDTLAHARATNESVQMTARRLRYDWLEALRQKQELDWILTAHHLQDSVETFFINLTRGTGLAGLTGIPERNQRILRPLLAVSQTEINDYYRHHNLKHREDQTNAERKYLRNKIRHDLVPVFTQINPAFFKAMDSTLANLRDSLDIQNWAVAEWKNRVWSEHPEGVATLNTQVIRTLPFGKGLLFALLQDFQFSSGQVDQIWSSVTSRRTGATFRSAGFELLVDREELVLRPIKKSGHSPNTFLPLPEKGSVSLPEGEIIISGRRPVPENQTRPQRMALFDADKLAHPLHLRRWRAGDRFQPFGMGGQSKKIKDYFTDQKRSRYDKENVWLLVDAQGEICWIVGERIDHRMRVTPQTTAIVEMEYLPAPTSKSG